MQGGLFSSGRKSPKDKSPKEKAVKEKGDEKIAIAIAAEPQLAKSDKEGVQQQQQKPSSPSHTRPYEYTEGGDNTSPTRKTYTPGGFRYDEDPNLRNRDSDAAQLSPNSQARRATGLAFSYAPGEDDKLREQAEKLKAGELSPKSREKLDKPTSKSYSPGAAAKVADAPGSYRPLEGIPAEKKPDSADFINKERDGSKVPVVPVVAAVIPLAASPEGKKKRVKIMVIVSKFDPKTKRIDAANGSVEHSTGIFNTETGKIETKYGVVDPKKGTVEILNTRTGNTDTYQGSVEPKTGNIHVTSGVTNPKTGAIDDTLGKIICISPQDKPVIDVTGIVGKLDPATGKIDIVNGAIERSHGLFDLNSDVIETKYGNIDLKTGQIKLIDPKSGKVTSTKPAKYDRKTGLFTIVGAVDPKTGKVDQSLGQLIALGSQIDPVVEVTSIVGKVDKKGIIDPKTSAIENTTGQINSNTDKIDTKYGQIDLVKHTIVLSDPKSGKTESKDIKIDPITGQILIKNVVNPKTGKSDKDFGQILALKIVNRSLDPATGQVVSSAEGKEVIVDPKTNRIWIAGRKDPKTNETTYTSSQVDAKTGTITIVFGLLNPKSNEVEKQQKAVPGVCVANEEGTLFTATGNIDDATNEPIFASSTIEPETKNIVTKVSKLDPKTGKIILVRIDDSKTQSLPAVTAGVAITASPSAQKTHPIQAKQVTPPRVPTSVTVTASAPSPADQKRAQTPTKPSIDVRGVSPPKQKTIDASVSPAAAATGAAAAAGAAGVQPAAVPIVPQKNAVIEIITITGKIDPKTGKVDIANGELERSRGILNVGTGIIDTKYGQINPGSKEIKVVTDPKSNKSVTKSIVVDPISGSIAVAGLTDPKTGKVDNNAGHVISFGSEIDPVVEVTAISGKYDAKRNIIDPKTAVVDVTSGQFDPNTNKITTSYGEIDIPSSTITFKQPKSGKLDTKDVKIDASTGQVILRNELNPKSGKLDKDYGRIISLRIVDRKIDPVTGKQRAPAVSNKDIIVDPQSNQIWTPDSKDPITNETIYTSAHVDPKTGYIITLYGYLNPKTNQITKQTKVESNITKVDPSSNQVFVATGQVDEATGEPLFATSQVDEESGEVYTKIAKVDPKTGKLILIKIILITKKDERGVPKEVDASTVDIDPTTGRIQNIFNKTVYVYNMVDPVTGEIIQVDPNDPRVAGARTTVTQTMTLTGEIDPITGRIKTEYGHIDPETGDIDPETAVTDPVTGKLILNYAQIDPSHFGRDVTIVKETVPISRDQFFDGIKHLGPTVVRHVSEGGDSSDDDMAQYGDETVTKTTTTTIKNTPTVVKTTTKQVLTKNEGGVTHNVEEEIHNLGTGEVLFSTQEHKVHAQCTHSLSHTHKLKIVSNRTRNS